MSKPFHLGLIFGNSVLRNAESSCERPNRKIERDSISDLLSRIKQSVVLCVRRLRNSKGFMTSL